MIKASELRLKNYVQGDQGQLFTVEGILPGAFDKIIVQGGRVFSDSCDMFYPVPLTEQVLLDCGFEAKKSTSHYEGKPKEYYCYSLLGFTYNDIQKAWWNKNLLLTNPPKYLHQLQNLVFATTGTELEYKPKER